MDHSSQNFPHLQNTSGTVYHENLMEVAAENFWRIAKTLPIII